MTKEYGINMYLLSALLPIAMTAQAVPTSEIIFSSGSDCGTFQGDLTMGRLFTLEVKKNQTLLVKTDGHVQRVVDSKGSVLKDEGGSNYQYVIKNSGTHTLKLVGRDMAHVEFCVY